MAYRPPSQRRSFRPSRGAVTFFCILAAMAGFIAFVIYDYNRPEPSAIDIPIEKPVAEQKVDLDVLKIENDKRKQDGRAVTYAGGDFYRQNSNVYPTGYAAGKMVGVEGSKPQAVALTYYKDVGVVSGAQPPLIEDKIRFVANADCAQSQGGTVVSSQPYTYVVQYSIKTPEGTYSPQCLRL